MLYPDMKFYIAGITRNVTNKYKESIKRKFSTFYYKLSGSVLYTVNGEEYTLYSGDILFVPQLSTYIVREIEEGEYISLHVNCDDFIELSPKKFSLHSEVSSLFTELHRLWITEKTESIFECYSLTYKLFAQIKHHENIGYATKSKYNLILPSIKYMEDHLFDSNLNVTSLGLYSKISYIYFYKIFKEIFKTTPINYIKEKRIAYAKNLFKTDEICSVSKAAEMVGYTDPFYFSRLFKKQTGISPKEYIQQLLN